VRHARGFSLIEMLNVVLVLGIVASISVAGFFGVRRTLNHQNAREKLVADIRIARQIAVTERTPVFMVFGSPPTTTNINTYKIHIDSDGDRIVDSNERNWIRTMPTGVLLTSVTLGPVDSLPFDPSGALAPGATGGRLVYTNGTVAPETLLVSPVGMVFRP
jgi:prepilin-type N-terminal cleavage/methylation domain-containing protein